jgi:alpha-mannosidase
MDLLAQNVYFADGYHGGIYGHYPLWQTQFMIDKLIEYPGWKINLELEPETWDSVQVKTPEAYEQWKDIVASPGIEFTNPAYAQPYCFNISGESIIRQFEYGVKKIRQHFPEVVFHTYATEEPCFTSALPQILRSFGFRYAVLKNPNTCWGGYVRGYGNGPILWTGPDGTSIQAIPRYACEALEKNSTWQTTAWNNSDEYLQACKDAHVLEPVGMCYQDAGWKNGPWLGYGQHVKNRSAYITWKEYFSTIIPGKTNDSWRLSQEDIQVSLMWGSQVLQRIARQVRQAENTIIQAEKIFSMAYIERNLALPDSLMDEAWRTLLLAQHHDSWIVPYNRLKKEHIWADEVARWTSNTLTLSEQVIREASISLPERNVQGLAYLKVYNTLPLERTEVLSVRIPEDLRDRRVCLTGIRGEVLPSVRENRGNEVFLTLPVSMPAFGYTTLRMEELPVQQPVAEKGITFPSPSECVMENDCYKLTFDLAQGGRIKSLIAKRLNHKEFVETNSVFGFGELRGYFYDLERFISNLEQPSQLTIIEDNAWRKQVRIESQINGNVCSQIITLNHDRDRIDFNLQINWNQNTGIGEYRQSKNRRENRRAFYDDRFKLNVLFPTALNNRKLYKDAPFDVCESRLENTFYNSWNNIKNNIILHWVDVVQADNSYGLALFSDHTTSYSHGENFPLALTLQYSGIGLWGVDYSIRQPLQVEYALLPHTGSWEQGRVGAQKEEWNEKPVVVFLKNSEMTEASFLQFDRQGYELTAFKPEGNEALILRIFNREGDEQPLCIRFRFPVSRCEEIMLNGEIKQPCLPEQDNCIRLAIPRFGIQTIRVFRKNCLN